jgi:glutamate-1-semialdehyde 2,1-aminomutase
MGRGDGARLWDLADGHEYVDFSASSPPDLWPFASRHPPGDHGGASMVDSNFEVAIRELARFAAAICARFPSIDLVRFTNSGTEANLMAVSAARAITGRPKISVFEGGYHGGVFYFRGHGSPLNAPFEYLLGRQRSCCGRSACPATPGRTRGDPRRADAGHHRLRPGRAGVPRRLARLGGRDRGIADLR